MSHGIMDNDKGFVYGTTWHNMPQYIQLDRYVNIDEAESVLDYEVEKVPLPWINSKGETIKTGCYGIIRKDTDTFLTNGSSIGNRFHAENNVIMLRRIDEFILAKYPDLKIESVGTLFNGQTAFINLRVDEKAVRGDKSPTETNLLYYNPIGKGSISSCAHNTRVVCRNTSLIALSQGAINQTLRKFSHTINAGQRIEDYLIDLSEVFLGLKSHHDALNYLAGEEIKQADIDAFLESIFPLKEEKGKGQTMAKNARESFVTVFERQKPTMEPETANSKYGLYQAYTDYIDHEAATRSNTDEASRLWDSITGIRASKKEKVFQHLLTGSAV